MMGNVCTCSKLPIHQRGVSYSVAREVMGKNIFGLKEAEAYWNIASTDEEIKILSIIPYSAHTLEKCKDSHILVAIPNICIHGIYDAIKGKDNFHYEIGNNWGYFFRNEVFFNTKKVRWILLSKELKKGQLTIFDGKTKCGVHVPMAKEIFYAICSHYMSTGETLFVNQNGLVLDHNSTSYDGRIEYKVIGIEEPRKGNRHKISFWSHACDVVFDFKRCSGGVQTIIKGLNGLSVHQQKQVDVFNYVPPIV